MYYNRTANSHYAAAVVVGHIPAAYKWGDETEKQATVLM